MLAVVGLGNPGAGYKKSRHNAGYMLLDGIAESRFFTDAVIQKSRRRGLRRLFSPKGLFNKSSGPYVSIEGECSGKRFLLVKPTTYMNESGKALSYLVRRGIVKDLSEILIVVDDINLNLGRIRLREKGSAGGQKGLKSIIGYLGTEEFVRLRIGIGPCPGGEDLKKYVLSSFRPGEKEILDTSLEYASEVVEAWVKDGFEGAQRIIARV